MVKGRSRSSDIPVRIFSLVAASLIATATVSAQDLNGVSPVSRPLEADEVARLEPSKLKQLVVRCQDQIEITSKLDGVMVVEMHLEAADEQRNRMLKLEGRVRSGEQRPLVARVVAAVMQTISFWSTSDDEFIVNGDKLSITPPSTEDGSKNLALGMEQFLAGQYEQADMSFTVAIAESPDKEVIQYWKAANAIGLKQLDRAEHRLEVLSRRNAAGSDTYASQLQRLQGPIRKSLIDMEQRILVQKRLGTGIK